MLPAFLCDPENSAFKAVCALPSQGGKGGGGEPPPNFTAPRRARSRPPPPPPRASDPPRARPPPGTIPRTHPKPLPPREGLLRTPSSEKPFNDSLSPPKAPGSCRDPQIPREWVRKTYHCGKEPENHRAVPKLPYCRLSTLLATLL